MWGGCLSWLSRALLSKIRLDRSWPIAGRNDALDIVSLLRARRNDMRARADLPGDGAGSGCGLGALFSFCLVVFPVICVKTFIYRYYLHELLKSLIVGVGQSASNTTPIKQTNISLSILGRQPLGRSSFSLRSVLGERGIVRLHTVVHIY